MPGKHSRPDPQLDDLVRRLRVWSFASWEHGDRIARTRIALQQLADLAADADGRQRMEVPELSVMALADQLIVLGEDAANCNGDTDNDGDDELVGILQRLAADLGVQA